MTRGLSIFNAVRRSPHACDERRRYFKNGRVKVQLALAKGKQAHDKRETIRRREIERETRAAVKARRR